MTELRSRAATNDQSPGSVAALLSAAAALTAALGRRLLSDVRALTSASVTQLVVPVTPPLTERAVAR